MKRLSLCAVLLLGALAPAVAQVTVEVTQEQNEFLPGETIITAVHITNHSGETLRLGDDPDWLSFAVESHDREIVPRTGAVPVVGEFLLPSSKVATKRVDLAPYFSAELPGGYSVTATVRIKGWSHDFTSAPKKFDVVEGARLWEQEVGLPQAGNATNYAPVTRKYILQQAHYLRNELRLYLRVTDGLGGKTYCVFPVGHMVSFGRPEPQVDRYSNLHLLYQDKAHSYDYVVFNPDGKVLLHETFDYLTTRPRLQPEGDGMVTVVGGSRRVTANDVPPPPPDELSSPKPVAPVPPVESKPPKS
ncbi:MAG TPA: hypothetical protein VMU04_14510 [Candidatus Acidoferrum sp.]|nr:hypothetical protein [Candidatus Acidoferrum sp.]